jgi:hypothetical protein
MARDSATLLVTRGKTAAPRRVLPLTPRARFVLECRWERASKRSEGWGVACSDPELYSFRHTFLTRLGEAGCDPWTLARIAGHSSVAISSRYVHPSEDAVLAAMSRLGGHNSAHSAEMPKLPPKPESREIAEAEGEFWRARRDSNSRPIAPEAIALSS